MTTWDEIMAEHEARLTVGQRVRVMPGEGCHSHGEQEAGVTGVIYHTGYPDVDATHRYLVLFDRPLWITRSQITTWAYSAAELTPIPWRTPEEVVAQAIRDALSADLPPEPRH